MRSLQAAETGGESGNTRPFFSTFSKVASRRGPLHITAAAAAHPRSALAAHSAPLRHPLLQELGAAAASSPVDGPTQLPPNPFTPTPAHLRA